MCAAFGLPEPGIGGTMITGMYLARRIERYLVQHPYVQTLVVNAFNVGRAGVLADMLLELQKQSAFADLRYDLRLFVPDPEAPGVSEALTELLSPTSGAAAKEADAFATSETSHLYPKLGLAIRSTAEFERDSDKHAAHVTFLFDVFPAREIGATRAYEDRRTAPVHGLLQDFTVDYTEDDHTVAWHKQPYHGAALDLSGAEELTDLLSHLPALFSTAIASVATGQVGPRLIPVVTLALGAREHSLIHQVHEVSDWVITVDRNMGIEFFDHGGRPGRPDYLIDHSPDMTSDFGHRLVVTSRSLQELEVMLEPVLRQYGLQIDGGHATALFYQIRSLSGRLALKLISSPTQRAEIIGLALARLYLDYQGVFRNQVVVPLDAHLELYHVLKDHADEIGDEVSFKRTDLALFDLNAAARTITCRLVEVKCYSGVGEIGAYNQLKDRIAAQIAQSEQVLAYHFDPQRKPTDRADRLLKTRELVTLLEFYRDRAVRYRLFDVDAVSEAQTLLATLERGYRLQFTRSALIFDFEKPGSDPPGDENGIEYHRVGRDLILQLVEAAQPVIPGTGTGGTAEEKKEEPISPSLSEADLAIPRLKDAAFLCVPRERSTVNVQEPKENPAAALPRTVTAERSAPVAMLESCSEALGAVGNEGEENEAQATQTVDHSADQPRENRENRVTVKAQNAADSDEAKYDILLGTIKASPQYGVFGEVSRRKVALDLNETHTISLFGVQGGGKSYTLGTIAEMASLPIPRVNVLPRPLATIIFHYSPTQDYKPEFTSMVEANSDEGQLRTLRERYGAEPQALRDLILLAPEDKIAERRVEYPHITVHPLKFAAAEL